MRIAIVAESFLPRVNGVSNSVVRVARHLRDAGHAVRIVAPDSFTAEHFEDIPVTRIASIEIPGIHATDVALTTSERLIREFRRFRPEVVHLGSPFLLGRSAIKAANLLGIPTVAIYQTDVAGFANHYGLAAVSTLADELVRRIHSKVDRTLVPSSHSERHLRSLGISKIERWGRGVDLETFNPAHRVPNLYGSDQRLRVGYVGRLAPEKNIPILTALAHDPIAEVIIIGDGPERHNLERAMPRARFLGMLHGTDLGTHMASLDVLVATGERETFCQVIQEGMAAGLPVLAPAIGGPLDLVTPGVNGFLYEPGNQRDLKRHFEHLLTHRDERLAMGRRARATVADRRWANVCDELVGHYEAVRRRKALAV